MHTFAVIVTGGFASLMLSCVSVTMIAGGKAHGDLHGLSRSDIQAAISASRECVPGSDHPVTDVTAASPTEIHLYWTGYGEHKSYGIMRLVRGKWICDGAVIVTS